MKHKPTGGGRPSQKKEDFRKGKEAGFAGLGKGRDAQSDSPFGAKKDFKKKQATRGSTGKDNTRGPQKFEKPFAPRRAAAGKKPMDEASSDLMPLNKFLAHSGHGSRRDAAALIKEGKVEVNGEVMTNPGYRVQPKDVVSVGGKKARPQKELVYVLLNKPKDYLTTTEDERGRRTVMELVRQAADSRLFPIGRLDRNTTGVLLLTNDGDLAQKLSHPRYEVRKVYHATLDKDLTKRDFDKIAEGLTLEDGPVKVDEIAYLEAKNEVGLQIHIGRNRIVRRIFESLGYEVVKLDRVVYAGLTKKNVPRGKWRYLNEKEIILLKHFKG